MLRQRYVHHPMLKDGVGVEQAPKLRCGELPTGDRQLADDVVLDGGGREGEPPPGASRPRVIRWLAANTRGVVRDGDVLEDFAGLQDWIVVAEFSDDAVTRLRLELVGASDGT